MDIKALLGDKYKDDMTAEQLLEAVTDLGLVSADELKNMVSKETFDKTASELSKTKKELRAAETASMTDSEKLKDELEKAAEAQSLYNRELSKLRAKEIFVTAGLTEEDYAPILEFIVAADEGETKVRALALVALIASQRKAAEKALRAELIKETPTPPGGKIDGGMTKEAFAKLSLLEKQKFATEQPAQYLELMKE